MKRVVVVILIACLLLTLFGCTSQKVKQERQEALKIAQSIPLPAPFYNTDNGHLMVHKAIRTVVRDYTADGGEPRFEFILNYYDSNWFDNWYWRNHVQYYLYIPAPPKLPVAGDYWTPNSDNGEWLLTLKQLQDSKDKLVWGR